VFNTGFRGRTDRLIHRRSLRLAFVVVAIAGFMASMPGASSDDFRTGDAQATADTITMNLVAANAIIGMTAGRSIASYQDRTGTAEGRALDLGGLPLIIAEPCGGLPSFLNKATLPPITRTDSSEPSSAASRSTQILLPGMFDGPAGAPIGFQDATATATPSSWASTETVPTDMILMGVVGGRTEVSSSLQDNVREAHAVSTAEQVRILGGLLTLNQVRWEATARSGAKTAATGSFTFASATVLGVTKTPEEAMVDLKGFKESTEKFLEPLGVTFNLPAVEVRDDGVKVTPMGFTIKNPPIGMNLIIPFLDQNAEQLASWRKDVVAQDCRNQGYITFIDALTAALGGSGSIEVFVGGVDTATHDTDYSVPTFEDAPPTTEPVLEQPQVAPAELTNTATDLGTTTDLGSSFDTSATTSLSTAKTPVASTPKAVTKKKATTEQPVLPAASVNRYEDGTAGKAGVAVGVLALLGALGLAMGDRLVGRRARRRIP